MNYDNIVTSLTHYYNINFIGRKQDNDVFVIVGETNAKSIRIQLHQRAKQVSIEVIDDGKFGYRSIQKVETLGSFEDQTIFKHITENLSL